MEVRAHVMISGLVQGVFFRREVMKRARYLGVRGWVRNLRDGRVEALIEGEKLKLEELISFCRRGPPGAKVSEVDVEWSDWKGEFQGFRITH